MSPPAEPPAPESLLVCFCHGVLEAEIRKAIESGARSLQEIKDRTRASTGCGGCTPEVERILEEALKRLGCAG